MKNLIFILLTLQFTFIHSSCDLIGLGEGKTCGDKQNNTYWRTVGGTGFFSDKVDGKMVDYLLDRYYTQGSANIRSSVIFEKWVQHVCPQKHVKIKVNITALVQSDLNVSSKAYWYFFYEHPITLKISNDGVSRAWDGTSEIGLKQVYGDSGEGEFTIQTTIDFPWQGSFEADSTYLYKNLGNVNLSAEYYDVK